MSDNVKVLIVGAGYMAKEYCKVLQAQNVEPLVVGRGAESAKAFEEEMGVPVIAGGLDRAFESLQELPEMAIVAIDVDQHSEAAIQLLNKGIKRILVEKPAGFNKKEIEEVVKIMEEKEAKIYVAYNRRYYASTDKALKIIEEDGGVTSFNFEFTEWSHVIEETNHAPHIKENWFFGNSTHVVDLAFFLGGFPKEISTYVQGELSWYKKASAFAGAGISDKGALFSYQANWAAPGRWGVEVLTPKHRLYLRPMEQLAMQNIGTVKVEAVEIDDELDKQFKPGLYKQTEAFLKDLDDGKRLSLKEQLEHMDYFVDIEGNK